MNMRTSTVPFDGPEALQADWEKYCEEFCYEKNKDGVAVLNTKKVAQATALNNFTFRIFDTLAQGKADEGGRPRDNEEFMAEMERLLNAFVDTYPGGAKKCARDICTAIEATNSHNKIQTPLALRLCNDLNIYWHVLCQTHAASPLEKNMTDEARARANSDREAILRSDTGSVIYNALHGVCNNVMVSQSFAALPKIQAAGGGALQPEVYSTACEQFKRCVYNFELGEGNFISYLTNSINLMLARAFYPSKDDRKLISLDRSPAKSSDGDKDKVFADIFADPNAVDPYASADAHDRINFVRMGLKAANLTPQEGYIVAARHGLNDGVEKTLVQIGREIEMPPSTVAFHYNKGRDKLKAWLRDHMDAEGPPRPPSRIAMNAPQTALAYISRALDSPLAEDTAPKAGKARKT